jgi:hypothetical protein
MNANNAITGSNKRCDEGAPLISVHVDGERWAP